MVLSVLICALRVTGMIIYSECETIGSVDRIVTVLVIKLSFLMEQMKDNTAQHSAFQLLFEWQFNSNLCGTK